MKLSLCFLLLLLTGQYTLCDITVSYFIDEFIIIMEYQKESLYDESL